MGPKSSQCFDKLSMRISIEAKVVLTLSLLKGEGGPTVRTDNPLGR